MKEIEVIRVVKYSERMPEAIYRQVTYEGIRVMSDTRSEYIVKDDERYE